jgi:hypothetical protein
MCRHRTLHRFVNAFGGRGLGIRAHFAIGIMGAGRPPLGGWLQVSARRYQRRVGAQESCTDPRIPSRGAVS